MIISSKDFDLENTMNANKTLIVFAEDWGRFPSSTQSLISALLKKIGTLPGLIPLACVNPV